MQKTILLLAISFLILSCGNQTQNKESAQNSDTQTSANDDPSKIGRSNYAVIWTTPNAQLISQHSEAISTEFTDLWKQDIIENAYFDKESGDVEMDQYPNIAFFLKAHSKKEAKSILDKLTLVKEGIASYKLYPVGTLWLDRKTEVINEKGITKSFVTVWTTQNQKPENEVKVAQKDKLMELWNAGAIENVYFDIEGTQQENDKTDFVLFVNANTPEEAESICKALPIFRAGNATYVIHPVGEFWFGKYGVQ